MQPTELSGDPVATSARDGVTDRVRRLHDRGTEPTLGTVLMAESRGAHRFMDLKHEACEEVGIATRDVRLGPEDAPSRLYRAVDRFASDPGVHAVFVQTPFPDDVDLMTVRERLAPGKDVDCFHPENLGRLVAGDPRYVPATPAAVLRLLSWYDVPTEGRHVVVVGRSAVIGRPLANLLVDESCGNATVTVCHSQTSNLGRQTRQADIVVTTAGVPGLVDGSMLSEGTVVVDVSANRVHPDETDAPNSGDGTDGDESRESVVVGDVDCASATEVAGAITPVPGGVGPVTLACLLDNVVRAAECQTDAELD